MRFFVRSASLGRSLALVDRFAGRSPSAGRKGFARFGRGCCGGLSYG